MKTTSSHFFEKPHTKLGWGSAGLMILFVGLFISVTTGFLHFSGFLTMTVGVVAGILTLTALIWKGERSWLMWLMLLPGLFAIIFALAEILIPH
ncbi:MAG: hypothetical protein EHM33_19260 [Chloroflexi bacterium]|nr:MAG: hypothetical protein EHM33_19260 [Chloroflexota bacterium]